MTEFVVIPNFGNGLDFGLHHSSKRLRFEAKGFYYHLQDFVFLAPTGDVEDDLIAEYRQGTTRYTGTEARLEMQLHPAVWLSVGADYVNAELTSTSTPLPRILPLRVRTGLEIRYKGLLLNHLSFIKEFAPETGRGLRITYTYRFF